MNTSIVGHGFVRNGRVQAGAVALLLAAALSANGARAADTAVEDDDVARPAVPAAPPAPASPKGSASPSAVPAPSASPEIKWDRNTRSGKSDGSLADIDAKMRDAQERLNRAASEVAALAAERAADAMDQIKLGAQSSRRAVIGVQLGANNDDAGAKVLDVSPGGPAELAGVRAGDVIVMVDGKNVRGEPTREVVQRLRDVEPESKVKLRVMRDGKTKDFDVVARPVTETFVFQGDAPPGIHIAPIQIPDAPVNFTFGRYSDLYGLELTPLTPQLGRYFGAEKGMLVVRAPKNDGFKLQDGDVILAIDGREPTSASHLTRILSSYQAGEQLTLKIMRDRKSQELVVTRPQSLGRTRTSWLFPEPL